MDFLRVVQLIAYIHVYCNSEYIVDKSLKCMFYLLSGRTKEGAAGGERFNNELWHTVQEE